MLLLVVAPLSKSYGSDSSDEELEPMLLSLHSAVLFGLDNNPDIKISGAQMNQSDAAFEKSKAALYPTLEVSGSIGREYNNPASGEEEEGKPGQNPTGSLSFLASQLLYDGGATRHTIRQQRHAKDAATIRYEAAVEGVINDVFEQYLAVYRYQKQLQDSKEFIGRVGEIVDIVNRMFKAGATGKVAVDYVKSRYAAAQVNLTETASALNDAKSNLEFITGPLPDFIAFLPEDVRPDAEEIKHYFDQAMKNNSVLRANEHDLAAREERLRAVKGSYYPTVDISVEGRRRYNDGGDVKPTKRLRALVNVNYVLFDGFDRDYEKKQTLYQIEELEARKERIVKTLRRQIKLSYNQLLSLRTSIEKTREEIKANEDLQDLNMQNFRLGNVNVIELMEGEERLNAARLREYDQIADLYLNGYQLLVLSGIMDKENFCASC